MRSTAILLASCAAVASARVFQVSINVAPDRHVNLLADLDELERTHRTLHIQNQNQNPLDQEEEAQTSEMYRSVSSGLGASIAEPGVYCQAYSDPNGRDELGDPFYEGSDSKFADEPVPIGSVLCVDDKGKLFIHGDDGDDGEADLGGEGDAGKGGKGGLHSAKHYVNVQFRTSWDKFVRGHVPIDSLKPTAELKLPEEVLDALVMSGMGVSASIVGCQLYEDKEGTKPVGEPFTTLDVHYGSKPVPVKAIKCTVS
ncbi:hypothetical protein FQN52_002512 [Onygenales sp. PD_12]|nr:hypothetical protein FQN52_002512 [Onygenales sp. PD_12]KAK2786066.1 hypothetical protein FQN53_006975 [Emmonsiellopsis sp. PD_33]KAK2799225.1 hypothetical protein FQN51_007055 [Onygenales sp. PD_10]